MRDRRREIKGERDGGERQRKVEKRKLSRGGKKGGRERGVIVG